MYNQTNKYVYLWDHESGQRLWVPPGRYDSFNQWVPWATNSLDFNRGHYIEVGYHSGLLVQCNGAVLCPRFSFWQENRGPTGDKIRWTGQNPFLFGPVSYNSNAQPMPGASNVGGRRNLIIRDLGVGVPITLDVELVGCSRSC